MADSKKSRFSWVGQFLAFVPGKTSEYQSAFIQVIAVESGTAGEIQSCQVKLDKSIRETVASSIKPRSWVKVTGKGKLDKKSGKMKWKAENIEVISLRILADVKAEAEADAEKIKAEAAQVEAVSRAPRLKLVSPPRTVVKQKPARILVCQKSSCRKRGSQKVIDAMEYAIAQANASDQITLKATGCLKCCKTGPTVVVLPASSKHKKENKETYRKVTPKSAKKIVASVL
ncbi:MAG: (2Fe-2S) ferredoxin domain-containing protein [Cyanobacteria bacterium P01_D01_bin.1]